MQVWRIGTRISPLQLEQLEAGTSVGPDLVFATTTLTAGILGLLLVG